MKTSGVRLKHGQVSDTDSNLRFWAYASGREYWVTAEKYAYLTELALKHKKIRYHQNPERAKQQNRIYRDKNKEHYLARRRIADKRRRANPKRKEWANTYQKRRRATNPRFAIGMRLRVRLASALARNKFKKTAPTMELLGCEWGFFLDWLESKFRAGMSWKNRNLWHIDHIIPCCAFDLSDPEQQRKCFHYTNLQPLWAKDNLTKQGKY